LLQSRSSSYSSSSSKHLACEPGYEYFRPLPQTRRAFVERWAKTTLGVTVLHNASSAMFAAETAAATPATGPGFGKAKNLIFLQMVGGMSHIDTLDPKEGETQGPVAPIKTKADFQLGGTMVNLAEQADKIAVVRSMTSKTGVHAAGQYLIRTGYEQRGTIKHPTIGAWAEHFKGPSHKTLPSSVCVNRQPNNGNGFFPASLSAADPGPRCGFAECHA